MDLASKLAVAKARHQKEVDATMLFELRAEQELEQRKSLCNQLFGQVQTLEELMKELVETEK